jgi:hypothetical protein
MFEYIKNSIFGSRLFNRTSSVEVESKRKQSLPKKKHLSFDSKQKEKKEALMTSKRHQHPEVIVHDDTATIKKYSYSKGNGENADVNGDFAIISDIDDDDQLQ